MLHILMNCLLTWCCPDGCNKNLIPKVVIVRFGAQRERERERERENKVKTREESFIFCNVISFGQQPWKQEEMWIQVAVVSRDACLVLELWRWLIGGCRRALTTLSFQSDLNQKSLSKRGITSFWRGSCSQVASWSACLKLRLLLMTCSKPCTFRWTNFIMIRACNEHESSILQNGRKAFMHGIRRFVCKPHACSNKAS